MMRKNLAVIFVLMKFVLILNGQVEQMQFNNLTTNDGLSSSNILCIQQDSKGFIWIGTYDGLNRYDGKGFEVYKNEPNNPNSLSDNLVRSIYIDSEDNIYVGTNSGICKYNNRTDQFINFYKDSLSCLYGFSFQAHDITRNKDGVLWIASNEGLIKFDEENNSFTLFKHDPSDKKSISNSQVTSVLIDDSDRIWVSTRQGFNLYVADKQSFVCIDKGSKGENFSDFLFLNISKDKDGTLWVNSEDGLFRVEKSDSTNIHLVHFKNNRNDPNSISSNMLSSSYVDSANRLWIGAENNGLYLYIPEQQNFSMLKPEKTNFKNLGKISVNAIFQDNSKNLWLGTYGHGLLIAPENGNAIAGYGEFVVDGLTFSDILVNTFLEDHKGKIWIGTDGHGIFEFNKVDGQFKNFSTHNSGIGNDYVLSMVEDSNFMIWMATWDGGLIRFDPKTNGFRSFTTKNSNIPDDKIYSIAKGDNNDLWLGSHYGGLIHFNPGSNEFSSLNAINHATGSNTVNIVKNNGKGELYIGTTTEFLIYSIKENTIKNYPEIGQRTGIVEINDIVFENDTCVWIGTLNGLKRFNPVAETFESFSLSNGLPGNVLCGLVIDNSGKLWISTTNGIGRFDYKNKTSAVFTYDDGLQSNEFKARSIQKDKDGYLYFGGVNGFNVINAEKLLTNQTIPKIQITGLDIFHIPVKPNVAGSPLDKIISETKEINLKYDQSTLTFHFAALDFTSPNKNEYAYILENFDKDWIYCGNSREATYTNLDPGTYIFRVIGSNNDGVWNEEGSSLTITVTPPWWRTWWFRLSVAAILLFMAFAVYYIRVSTLKKQKEILEERVKSRTEELAKLNATKDKLFSIVAHDLKNPFNVILGYTNILIEDFDSFDKKSLNKILAYLKESGENAYALLENLLNWSMAQRGTIDFKPVEKSASEMLQLIIDEVAPLAIKKKIEILNYAKAKNISVFIDSNLFLLICRNLLTNAIKFSNPGQTITVDVVEKEEFVVFSFTDQGIGIEPDKAKQLFNLGENNSTHGTGNEKGTGLGLVLSKEFVSMHGGEIWVESKPGQGSTFYFSLPNAKKQATET